MPTSSLSLCALSAITTTTLCLGAAVAVAAPVEVPRVHKKRVRRHKRPKPRLSKTSQLTLEVTALQAFLRTSNPAHDVRAFPTRAYGLDFCAVDIDDVTYNGQHGRIRAWTPGELKLQSKPDGGGKRRLQFACSAGDQPCELWFYGPDGERHNAVPTSVRFGGMTIVQASKAVQVFDTIKSICPAVIEESKQAPDEPATPEEAYRSAVIRISRNFVRRGELIFPPYAASTCEVQRQNTQGSITSTLALDQVTAVPNNAQDAVMLQCPGSANCIEGHGPQEDAPFLTVVLRNEKATSVAQQINDLRALHPACN